MESNNFKRNEIGKQEKKRAMKGNTMTEISNIFKENNRIDFEQISLFFFYLPFT